MIAPGEVPERALTTIQPMGTALVRGWKPVENRKWRPWPSVLGKLVAVHAGQKWDRGYYDTVARLAGDRGGADLGKNYCQQSAILGVVRVVGWLENAFSSWRMFRGRGIHEWSLVHELPANWHPWYSGPYGWVVMDAVQFREPVPAAGARGLWELSAEQRVACAAAIALEYRFPDKRIEDPI